MIRTRAGRVAGLAVLVAPLALLPTASSGMHEASAPSAAAAALDHDTRLAFTDERDGLYESTVGTYTSGTLYNAGGAAEPLHAAVEGFSPDPVHDGELSSPGDDRVFVSTRDDPNGEIYLASAAGTITRVTCDPGTETHPVLNGDTGQIAFASDADGDWDIYVLSPSGGLIRPAPGWSAQVSRNTVTATAASPCDDDDWDPTQVTGNGPDEHADLWPTWTRGMFDNNESTGLAFSRAADGELSDLWSSAYSGGEWQSPQQLTNTDHVAESQPAAAMLEEPGCFDPGGTCDSVQYRYNAWLAFTTTEDRSDGSIRMLRLATSDERINPWLAGDVQVEAPQGSQPTWSGSDTDPVLAFTSTSRDPYGDIWVAKVLGTADNDPSIEDQKSIAGLPGTADTHPAWITGFDEDGDAALGFTSRVYRPWRTPGTTDRTLDADISDVRAIDGSDRSIVIDEENLTGDTDLQEYRFDEAGPSYSPDGSRIAYSTNDEAGAAQGGRGRVIRIANADGSSIESLGERTDHQAGDVDRDPAWSPDGTRVAFVREAQIGEARADPKVWILDLTTDELTQLTPPTGEDLPGEDLDDLRWLDGHPDWSPDGTQLVVERRLVATAGAARPAPAWGNGNAQVAARAEGHPMPESELWVIPTSGGVGAPLGYMECGECALEHVAGRTPAWSPDGSQIVYSRAGQLELLTFADDVCCEIDTDLGIIALTGFDNPDDDDRTPTAARPTLSWTDDPAWASDGSEIAFAGQPAGQPDQRDIWAISPDGTGLRQITDGRGPETEPAYQPMPVADLEVSVAVAGSPADPGESVTATFTVTNHGPNPAFDVELVTGFGPGADLTAVAPPADCENGGGGCSVAVLQPDTPLTYKVTIEHPSPVSATATGSVSTTSEDPDSTDDTDQAPYVIGDVRDVGVTVELDEPVGYVGGIRTATVTVSNLGGEPAEDVELSATWPDLVLPAAPDGSETPTCLPDGDECDLGDLEPGDEVGFAVSLEGAPFRGEETLEGTGTIEVDVATSSGDHVPGNDTDEVDIEILQPTFRVVPAVARPGQAVMLFGENMPPGSEVEVAEPGDDPVAIPPSVVTVAADGTIRTSVYLIRRSQVGQREWTATSTTEEFSSVQTGLLMVLRPLRPPNFAGRG